MSGSKEEPVWVRVRRESISESKEERVCVRVRRSEDK